MKMMFLTAVAIAVEMVDEVPATSLPLPVVQHSYVVQLHCLTVNVWVYYPNSK